MQQEQSNQIRGKPIQLYYWNLRGIAQPIRHLLEFLNIKYIQIFVENPQKWFTTDLKAIQQQCVFTSLPYINDNGFIVSQTTAIAKYLCKKANRTDLLGKTYAEQAKVQQMMIKITRSRNRSFQIWTNNLSNDDQIVKQRASQYYQDVMTEKGLLPILRLMQMKQIWLLDSLTIVDFFFYQSCFYIAGLFPNKLGNFNKMLPYMRQFENLNGIKQYTSSEKPLRIFVLSQLKKLWKGDPKYI